MATSLAVVDFDSWLSTKLQSLNTDEGVFGNYITGILTGEESLEDKTEALEGILSEISGSDITSLCSDILDKWKEYNSATELDSEAQDGPKENVEEKLVRLLGTSALSTPAQREYTADERRVREAILSQYAQTSDQESGDEEIVEETKEKATLVRNTNVSSVVQAEKEKREKAKVDSQKKKEKDREDRERQRQQQQEKKEKRKTQKGERKR